MKWAISYNKNKEQLSHIFQATIPLIKITFDPSIDFLDFGGNPLYYVINHKNIEKQNLKFGELCIYSIKYLNLFNFQIIITISYVWIQGYHINVSKIQDILQIFEELYLELKANINQIDVSLNQKLDQKEFLYYIKQILRI
ncbi:unnamed protein product [Paramecium sonneborni]|uniref:Uncharacterized protein n=1 Tax=Paramecium sonneborni TaxID=65129 RepID=A0A8S1QRU0_9CILI|nr:unnamed protein product [Paramecium sonneborni]